MIIDKTEVKTFKYCTNCNRKIAFQQVCYMCENEICLVCDGRAFNNMSLCNKCWDAGTEQREQIHALEDEIEALYAEWRAKCQ